MTPNYGLLSQAVQPQQKGPTILEGFLSGLEAKQKNDLHKQQLALNQSELDFVPEKQRIALEEAAQAKQMNAMNMQTTSLQQQQLKQKMQMDAAEAQQKKLTFASKSLGSIFSAPEELQQAMLNATIPVAAKNGMPWPKDVPKDINNPKTRQFLQQMHIQSGDALEQLKLKREQDLALAKVPLVKTVDANGNPVYVRQDQATGMPAYEAPTKGQLSQTKGMQTFQAKSAEEAQNATKMKEMTEGFMTAAGKIRTGTGPGLSTIAKLSAEGQKANKFATNLVQTYLPQLKGSVSDKDIAFLQSGTLSLSNLPAANQSIANVINASATRLEEKPKFLQKLRSQGINDPALADSIWSAYITENPIVNHETGKANLANAKNWQKYVTPGYIKKFESGEIFDETPPPQVAPAQNSQAPQIRKYNPQTGKIE